VEKRAGIVKAVGPDVKSFAVGDRVSTTLIYGAFAERIVVPEMATVKLPDAVSFEVAQRRCSRTSRTCTRSSIARR